MDKGFKVFPEKKPLTDKKDKNTNNANTCTLKEIGRAGSCLSEVELLARHCARTETVMI